MNLKLFRNHGTFVLIAIAVCGPIQVNAEEISLENALYEAIEENLSLRINAYQTYLREQDLQSAQSKFDPTLFGSVNTSQQKQGWSQSESESTSASVGASQRYSTGTSVSLQSRYIQNDGSRFDAELNQQVGGNSSFNMGITLSVRQALLQGFGKSANMASVWKSEASLAVAELEYKNSLLDAINQTEKAYWAVAYQNAVLELSRSSVALAEDLLDETQQREELGLSTKLDVLQAKANLASQKESFIDSQRGVKDAEDGLLVAMGRLNPNYQDHDLEVGALPDLGREVPSLSDAWSGALVNDLDLMIQQTNIESLGFDKIIAKDRNKSELDFVASGSTSGFSGTRRTDAFSGALEKDGNEWGVGLEFNIPIGKRAGKAYLNQVEASIEREKVRLEQIEQALFLSVRRAWRAYDVSLEKLDASRVTLELQRAAFEQEQAKFKEGLAVFRDVQQAQEALDRAMISELNAWHNAVRSLADLSRLDGSILNRHNINLNFN